MNVLVRGPSSAVMSFVVLGWGCRKGPRKDHVMRLSVSAYEDGWSLSSCYCWEREVTKDQEAMRVEYCIR